VQAVGVVGGDQLACGEDVGVRPSQASVGVHAHFGELLAGEAKDVVAGRSEAADGRVAAHRGDAALGDAQAVGIVDVAGLRPLVFNILVSELLLSRIQLVECKF